MQQDVVIANLYLTERLDDGLLQDARESDIFALEFLIVLLLEIGQGFDIQSRQ
jgi:hypothetical protein